MRIKRYIKQRISLLLDINCYKGICHQNKLPCRGQRTRTNAKTTKHIKKFN